jgi:hypothetical protein
MPRSPSRDLSDRYTGKRGYFRNPDALRWWKYALAWLALAGAVAWAAVDIAKPYGASYAHTHGPLANPHAAFDNNCAACHVAHAPSEFGVGAVFDTRARWHDLTCEKCHTGAAHHASVTDDAKNFHNRCSNCHHDHNGRLNSLVRISDNHCTHCHTDLGKSHDAAKSLSGAPYQNKVTSFVTDHPDFRSLKIDSQPRALTFSHAVHMNPGQAYSADGKEAMTVKKLRNLYPDPKDGNAAVARYAPPGAGDETKIQLECASCHKLDPGRGTPEFDKLRSALDATGEPTRSMFPPRPEGAYYLPVNYEANCRACHPLSAPEGTSAGKVIARFDVPHRKQTADLLGDLKAGYLKGMIAAKHPALAEPPEPGGKLDTAPPTGARTLAEETDRLATNAQRLLFSGDGCAKCHKTTGPEPLRIAPVPDRSVWLSHAKFNHAAHRGATCASCHPGTVGASVSPVEAAKPEPVQILGVDSCRACHSPLSTKVTVGGETLPGGGVRHNCTDCHRYHHGDQPMQGRGGDSWFPKDPRSLADWLKGK